MWWKSNNGKKKGGKRRDGSFYQRCINVLEIYMHTFVVCIDLYCQTGSHVYKVEVA